MFHMKHCTICTVVCCVTFPQTRLQTKHVWNTHTRATSLHILYYIYGLVLCSPLVCAVCSVSMYARKPFCFVFGCKNTTTFGHFRKNTKNLTFPDRLEHCKMLKMKGCTPDRQPWCARMPPIDIFYFLIFSDFYFSFFYFIILYVRELWVVS